MPTIEDQIKLEKRMVAYGISRYQNSIKHAEEAGRGADTSYATKLMQEFLIPVSDVIQEFCNSKRPGPRSKYRVLMRQVDPMKLAFFGLKALFNHFLHDTNLQKLASHIGMMAEDEIKFMKFEQQHGDYYNAIVEDFKRKGTQSYRHMHRVLTYKANEKDIRWGEWSSEDRIAVGVKIVDCIMEATDLIDKRVVTKNKKKAIIIDPSPDAIAWIKDYNEYAQMLNPDRVPCIIEPDNWTEIDQGGYYSPQLRKRTPMVKTRSKKHTRMFDGDISLILSAINGVQRVPWMINQPVFDVFKQAWDKSLSIGLPPSEPYIIPQCPLPKDLAKKDMSDGQREIFENWKEEARVVHTMERERVSKCFQAIRVMRLANEFSEYDRFWFVYQCDFRGRIYATTSGLSPQGPDFSKGLLQFAEGKELTERGLFWLRVHGANTYGYDKASYDDRVQWSIDREEEIASIAADPLTHRGLWSEADKPWQYLAFCFEYARYLKEGVGMMSYLPIGLDGSCNGLQNFSAMLRDEVGGKATNLTVSDVPADIYSEVASVCTQKLRNLDAEEAKWWLRYAHSHGGQLPRSVAKKPVMTLPYGSTQQSCRESIFKYIVEETGDFFPKDLRFKLSVFLTPVLWESIGEVVVAARQAMDWIQDCAGILAKENKPIVWWTPIGFPVYQDKQRLILSRVQTQLAGAIQISVAEQSGEMDVLKNKQGASPNFVHSMDACHLMLALNLAQERGLRNFACIHDDFGTHAADTDEFHSVIREAFVWLYGENDPLVDFKIFNEDMSQVELPDPPSRGSLNLDQVIDSKYFFG